MRFLWILGNHRVGRTRYKGPGGRGKVNTPLHSLHSAASATREHPLSQPGMFYLASCGYTFPLPAKSLPLDFGNLKSQDTHPLQPVLVLVAGERKNMWEKRPPWDSSPALLLLGKTQPLPLPGESRLVGGFDFDLWAFLQFCDI